MVGSEVYHESLLGGDVVRLCPPHSSENITISVYAYSSFTSYDLICTEYAQAIAPQSNIFFLTRKVLSDNYLIGDGVGQTISSPKAFQELVQYHFRFASLNHSCIFHAEAIGNTELVIHLNGSSYAATQNVYNGRSYLDLSICDAFVDSDLEENIDSPVWFTVNTSDFAFDVFASTSNLFEIVPLDSLYLLEILDLMNSDAFVKFPPSMEACGVTNVWSTLSSSPFNPPQDFLFSENVSFAEIDWNLPNRSVGNDRTIYTYLLLGEGARDDAEGFMENFYFSFGPALVDEDGRSLTSNGRIYPTLKENITCDSDAIDILMQNMEEYLSTVVSLDVGEVSQVYSNLVLMDIVRSNLTWIACGQQIEYSINGSDGTVGEELCEDWNCTLIYFENYVVNEAQIEVGSCDDTSIIIDANRDNAWYKGCKEMVFSVTSEKKGRPCDTDIDCLFPWSSESNLTYFGLGSVCQFTPLSNSTSRCDTFVGICSDTQESAEDLFWWCFVMNMTTDVQLTLSLYDGIDPCNISQIRKGFSTDDCVSKSGTGMSALPYRSHYSYMSAVSQPIVNQYGIIDDPARDHCACFLTIANEYDLCLDSLCNTPSQCAFTSYDSAPTGLLLPKETSVKNDICSYTAVLRDSDESGCLAERRCNWNPNVVDRSENGTDCVFESDGNEFCGVRFDEEDIFFHEIVHVTKDECLSNDGEMCVTPDGSILLGNISRDDCLNEIGYCTQECPNDSEEWNCLPVDRKKASLCYNSSDGMDESMCVRMSGEWSGGICIFPLQNDREECGRNGNVFIECQNVSIEECDSHPLLTCYLSITAMECDNGEECEQAGISTCSDAEYFVNYMTSPPTNGSCVVPFEVDVSTNVNRSYCYVNTIPTSLGYDFCT